MLSRAWRAADVPKPPKQSAIGDLKRQYGRALKEWTSALLVVCEPWRHLVGDWLAEDGYAAPVIIESHPKASEGLVLDIHLLDQADAEYLATPMVVEMRRRLQKVVELAVDENQELDPDVPQLIIPPTPDITQLVELPKKKRKVKSAVEKIVATFDNDRIVVLSTTDEGRENLVTFSSALVQQKDRLQVLFDSGRLNGNIFLQWLDGLEKGDLEVATYGAGGDGGVEIGLPDELVDALGDEDELGSLRHFLADEEEDTEGHKDQGRDGDSEVFIGSSQWPPTAPEPQESSGSRKRGATSTPLEVTRRRIRRREE